MAGEDHFDVRWRTTRSHSNILVRGDKARARTGVAEMQRGQEI